MAAESSTPTFLLATGYEQVRSIAAHLAGDERAAAELTLDLPETGVCSASAPILDADGEATIDPAGAGCCGTSEPAFLGIPTGLRHGRSGDHVLN